MKICVLILLCVSTMVAIVNARAPPEIVIHTRETKVILQRTYSLLANENLPVYIINKDSPNVLVPLRKVKKDIGPIHVYHDVRSCSAVVFFEKYQYFDGIIDKTHAVKKLYHDYDNRHPLIIGKNIFPSDTLNHPETEIYTTKEIHPDDVDVGTGKNWRYVRSRMGDPQIVYIETLVIVNYDLLETLSLEEVISDVLVTMNNVDMLYSRLDEPKIKINIAGIIIGMNRESFPSLVTKKCYRRNIKKNFEAMDVMCVNAEMKMVLNGYRKTIPLNSYDVVVFFTNFKMNIFALDKYGKTKSHPVNGLASMPTHDNYIGYKLSAMDIGIVTVRHYDHFEHFQTVAHEIAHLFNVNHEPGPLRIDGQCSGNLMRTGGKFCKRCLFFGDPAQKQMKRFFRSREGCIYRNEPRSLNDASSATFFWNEHQACQCYGFQMAKKPQQIDCEYQERLKCLDGERRVYNTGLFMDGTLCGNDHGSDFKVCWNGQCVRSYI